jgi:biopolymer transport protein ExbD
MQFRKRDEEDYSIPLTSLIDVVFLLLIFFMVSTVFIDFSKKMDIALPESKASDLSADTKNIEIEIGRDKKMYLNGEETTIDKLELRIKNLSNERKRKTVIIRADKGLPYGEVIKIMGICKDANIMDIAVAVK